MFTVNLFSPEKAGALPAGNWNYIWGDDFDGTSGSAPDPTKWCYWSCWNSWIRRDATLTTEDAYLDGSGHLVIRSRMDGTTPKTSMLATYDEGAGVVKKSFHAGPGKYFECSVKLTDFTAQGQWFAFWLQAAPTDAATYDGNPTNGNEMDIAEYIKFYDGYYDNAVHPANLNGNGNDYQPPYPDAGFFHCGDAGINLLDGNYHTFGLEWYTDKLAYYIDGYPYWTCTQGVNNSTVDTQGIMLSIEIQGYGAWNDQAHARYFKDYCTDPNYVYIDYVKVYEKSTTPTPGRDTHTGI